MRLFLQRAPFLDFHRIVLLYAVLGGGGAPVLNLQGGLRSIPPEDGPGPVLGRGWGVAAGQSSLGRNDTRLLFHIEAFQLLILLRDNTDFVRTAELKATKIILAKVSSLSAVESQSRVFFFQGYRFFNPRLWISFFWIGD